jgi:uncharacterized OB-fold protein
VRDNFPLPDTAWEPTKEFWSGAAAGELRIPRCTGCGRYQWYPLVRCRRCGDTGWQWAVMSGSATLFSWVVVDHAFLPQFRDQVPFVPGLVALDEDPAIRLTTRIVDASPNQLAFDQPMRVTFRPITFAGVDGSVIAPLFTPASS